MCLHCTRSEHTATVWNANEGIYIIAGFFCTLIAGGKLVCHTRMRVAMQDAYCVHYEQSDQPTNLPAAVLQAEMLDNGLADMLGVHWHDHCQSAPVTVLLDVSYLYAWAYGIGNRGANQRE